MAWGRMVYRQLVSVAVFMAAVMVGGAPRLLVAQGETGTVVGVVLDINKQPMPNVEVFVLSSNGKQIVRSGGSRANGEFVFDTLKKGKYLLAARKIGFAQSQSDVTVVPGDTVKIVFELHDIATQLGQVDIKKNRGSALTSNFIQAGEFNPSYVYSVADLLKRYRPKMFGDAMKCPLVGEWHVQHVYVNGVRKDRYSPPAPTTMPGIGRAGDTVPINPEVIRVLDMIQSKDVQEIRYSDCRDPNLSADRKNSLYIVLKAKPLTKKQMDEIKRNTQRQP